MLGEMYYQNRFLTDSECESLIDYFKENREEATRGVFGYPPNASVEFYRRTCKVLTLDQEDEKFKPIIAKVTSVVKQANEDIFLFDIDWKQTAQSRKNVWITEYDGSEKAHWANHQNVNWISNHLQTKICASLILSNPKDYEGGDVILNFATAKDLPTPTELRARAILYVYPAFRYTQINPVLSGFKYHLDFNYVGPYWR